MEFRGRVVEDGKVGGGNRGDMGMERYNRGIDGISSSGIGRLEALKEGGEVGGRFEEGIGDGSWEGGVRVFKGEFKEGLVGGGGGAEEGEDGGIFVEKSEKVGIGEEDGVEVGEGGILFV